MEEKGNLEAHIFYAKFIMNFCHVKFACTREEIVVERKEKVKLLSFESLKASAVLIVSTYALKANLSLGCELMLRGVNVVKAYAKADWISADPCSNTTPATQTKTLGEYIVTTLKLASKLAFLLGFHLRESKTETSRCINADHLSFQPVSN